ncbi:hypothetical protein Tco_1334000 [Tanacetum coccineum]
MKILPEPSSNKLCGRGSYALSWKPCQGDSSKLNIPDHRYKRRSSLKIKDYQDKDCQRRLLESFKDDAKCEHIGQDTKSQGGNDDKDIQGKDLKILELKTKSKDNDKGSRSKIA